MGVENPDDPHWFRSNKGKLALLAALVPLIIAIINISPNFLKPDNSNGAEDSKPSLAASATPDESSAVKTPSASPSSGEEVLSPPTRQEDPASSATPGDDSGSDPTQQAEPSLQYLSDLTPITDHYGSESGSANISGADYAHSVWVAEGGCTTSKHEIEYNIGSGWKTFTAWVGLGYKSDATYKIFFQVYRNGEAYGDGYTQTFYGAAKKIVVPVAGKQRITLTQTWVSGGKCDSPWNIAYTTWGDAQLRK